MALVYIAVAWTIGILLGHNNLSVPPAALWIAAALSLLLALLRRRDRIHRMILVCTTFAILGILRISSATQAVDSSTLKKANDQGWASIEGVIIGEPDVRDSHINLHVQVEMLNREPATGSALVQAERYGTFAYGDRVWVEGTPLTPPEFDTFSYRDYLARQGITALVPNARVEVLSTGAGNPIYAALYKLKSRAQAVIAGALPEPQSSLLTGILLGVETGISPPVRDAFNATGASHVIAISGFNMTLIAGILSRALALIWPRRRRMTAVIGLTAITLYTLLVGADGAVVRAAVMSGLLIIAPLTNRRAYVPASLAFAALIMSLLDPFILWDVGFQLSLAAVIGLALFVAPIENGFRTVLRRFMQAETAERAIQLLSEPLIVTLAAQITTLPLIALYFQRFSIVSMVVNFLILPAQTPLLLLGGAASLVGLASPAIAQPLYWGTWVFLSWTIEVVRFFAHLPFADVGISVSPPLVTFFFVGILLWAIVKATQPEVLSHLRQFLAGRRIAAVTTSAGALAAVILWTGIFALPDGLLHVQFLDSGESNAVLITTPHGSQILVDGGQYPTRLLTALGDYMPFWDREVELVILTQPKDRQFSALPAVLDRYRVGLLITTGQDSESDDFAALRRQITENHTAEYIATAGSRVVTSDGVTLEVLFPPVIPARDSAANDMGMVLRLAYGEASFLLTPDLSASAEESLLTSGRWLHAAVLQLPSHGAANVTSRPFLQAVAPQIAVVQAAPGNRVDHPSREVIERLGNIPLYRTDHSGQVAFATDGQQLWVTTARDAQ